MQQLTRRAQSLYCAIGRAKRRNKAIAPYGCYSEPMHFASGSNER
jgi:hypothetical protein